MVLEQPLAHRGPPRDEVVPNGLGRDQHGQRRGENDLLLVFQALPVVEHGIEAKGEFGHRALNPAP